jgi:hypothetical protein
VGGGSIPPVSTPAPAGQQPTTTTEEVNIMESSHNTSTTRPMTLSVEGLLRFIEHARVTDPAIAADLSAHYCLPDGSVRPEFIES